MVNHPRCRLISWKVQYLGANLPRCMPESWTVRGQKGEPSTLVVDIVDGSISRGELPRCMPESWTVRGQKGEPSTPVVDIMEGSISRGEPSTLYARIVDGSRPKGRTFHAEGRYHGRFNILSTNLPRCMPESWMVRGQKGEPSMLKADIMEGSIS